MQALLGYDENQNLTIYVNPLSDLNKWGDRLERGTPFPATYHKFRDAGTDPLQALSDLQRYIDKVENREVQPRSLSNEPEIRKGKSSKFSSKKRS